MEVTQVVLMIVVVLAVSAAIVGVVYFMLKQYFEQQTNTQQKEWRQSRSKDHFPLQLQAFERLILFLERINPERLVFRVNKPGMSARLLQSEILKIVREEFDHNLTQQLYVSSSAWESVKAAREETLKVLNVAAERVHKDADAMALSKAILEVSSSMDRMPTEVAIDILKKEFRKILNG